MGAGLLGGVPPCGHGGSLREGGGDMSGGSRGGGGLKTDESVWLLWDNFSRGECLGRQKVGVRHTLAPGFWFQLLGLGFIHVEPCSSSKR